MLRVASQVKREWRGLATVSMLTVAVRLLLFFFLKWISEWYSIRWPVNSVMSYAWLFFSFLFLFSSCLLFFFFFWPKTLVSRLHTQKKNTIYSIFFFFFLLCLTAFFSFFLFYFILFCTVLFRGGAPRLHHVLPSLFLQSSSFFVLFFFIIISSFSSFFFLYLFRLCSAVKEARKSWRTKKKQTNKGQRSMHVISSFWLVPRKKKKKKAKQWSCSTLTSGIALPRVLITVCQRHRVPTSRVFFFSFATCTGVFILYHEASSMLSLYPSFFPHFPSLTLPWGSFFFFSIADKLSNKQKIIKKKKVQQQKRNTVAAEKKKTVLLCVLKRKGEEPKKQTSLFFFSTFRLFYFLFLFFFLLRITLLRFLFHRQCQGGRGKHRCARVWWRPEG